MTPSLVLSLSFSSFALLSLSSQVARSQTASAGSTSLGGSDPQQGRNTYQAGVHDGAQAGIESVRGQAEASAGSANLASQSDTGSSKGGCS